MGYPMSYTRVLTRNGLDVDYIGNSRKLPSGVDFGNPSKYHTEDDINYLNDLLLKVINAKSLKAKIDLYENDPQFGQNFSKYITVLHSNKVKLEFYTTHLTEKIANMRKQYALNSIGGDLQRLETDQRDGLHLHEYADQAGTTLEQVRTILDAFFQS